MYTPLNTTQQLVPPKPKALDRIIHGSVCGPRWGPRPRRPECGSGIWFIVGRMIPCRIPSMAKAASIAAAPPRVCPICDLLDDTGIFSSCLPNTSLQAFDLGLMSPFGVEVPWALTYWMSPGCKAGVVDGLPDARR